MNQHEVHLHLWADDLEAIATRFRNCAEAHEGTSEHSKNAAHYYMVFNARDDAEKAHNAIRFGQAAINAEYHRQIAEEHAKAAEAEAEWAKANGR